MAATNIFNATTAQGTTSTFTVGAASRVSLSLKGLNQERGKSTNRAEFTLLYDDGSIVYIDQKPVVLHADNNSVELLHAGIFKFSYVNPNGLNVILSYE